MRIRRNPFAWWRPGMTVVAAAAELVKRHGGQAMGWAKTCAAHAPRGDQSRYWSDVHTLLRDAMAQVRRNPTGRLRPAARLPKKLSEELRRGTKVEMEHTRDARTARIIASQHLAEDPQYYTKLAKMERRNPGIGRRNPQRPSDPKHRFLALRVAAVIDRILAKGISSPVDPSVFIPRENLGHQVRGELPVEFKLEVPALAKNGRPARPGDDEATPSFTLVIGYYKEDIAGRHRAVHWSGGGIEHSIILNTRASEVDLRRTSWAKLSEEWLKLPRPATSYPTPPEVFNRARWVAKNLKSTLVHEITHLLDTFYGRIKAKVRQRAAPGGTTGYYNDPAETNAFYHMVAQEQAGIHKVLFNNLVEGKVTVREAVRRFRILWPSATAFVRDTFKRLGKYAQVDLMSDRVKRSITKRAAGLYEDLRAKFRHLVRERPRSNPADHPVMTYRAAHAWEPQASERGVSTVARSARGFMRAYERAGGWAALDPWWKRRRAGFIARHMAQANRGERLWEKVKGRWRPTRRCLALIMWAFMPPGKPAGCLPKGD